MNRLELPLPPIAIADRQPPYAPEAEISVLGGMLQDGEAVPKALEIVREDMFYREANRRVFAAMMRLYRAQQIIDPVTLREELDKTDDLDAIGGQIYIGELLDAVPTAANIEYHARIVRDRAILRRLINAGTEMIRDSYEPGPRTISEVLDRAEQRVFEVSQSHERKGFVWIKEVLKSTFEVIEKYQHAEGGITGVETGIYKLDDLRVPARGPGHRCGAPQHGQDRSGHWYRAARRHRETGRRRHVLARDVARADRAAHALLRGAGRSEPPASRPTER
jgi:hypothetical protein